MSSWQEPRRRHQAWEVAWAESGAPQPRDLSSHRVPSSRGWNMREEGACGGCTPPLWGCTAMASSHTRPWSHLCPQLSDIQLLISSPIWSKTREAPRGRKVSEEELERERNSVQLAHQGQGLHPS